MESSTLNSPTRWPGPSCVHHVYSCGQDVGLWEDRPASQVCPSLVSTETGRPSSSFTVEETRSEERIDLGSLVGGVVFVITDF